MSKASWNDVTVARPYKPSMLTHHVPRTAKRRTTESGAALPMGHIRLPAVPVPFREPQKLDLDGARWFAVRTAHASERPLQAELEGIGYRVYCPLVTKWAWKHGRRCKDKRQTPLFARYIFVGCAPHQRVSRRTAEGIVAVLGDKDEPLAVPERAIGLLSVLEIAGEWDETRDWSEKTPFQPGRHVQIAPGIGVAFAGLDATVDVAMSEERIRVLISLFNQATPVEIDACNLVPL